MLFHLVYRPTAVSSQKNSRPTAFWLDMWFQMKVTVLAEMGIGLQNVTILRIMIAEMQ